MKIMKITLCIIAYLALLLPTLLVALNKLVDIADPPVVTPDTGHSFWLTGIGECLWFGVAFILPALVVLAFWFAMRRIWNLSEKDSHVVVYQDAGANPG